MSSQRWELTQRTVSWLAVAAAVSLGSLSRADRPGGEAAPGQHVCPQSGFRGYVTPRVATEEQKLVVWKKKKKKKKKKGVENKFWKREMLIFKLKGKLS